MKLRLLSILLSVIVVTLSVPSISSAATAGCGQYQIKYVWVNGNRDDNNAHANKIVLDLIGPACNGFNKVYIENTNPAYDAILATALEAFSNDLYLVVYVNTSTSIADATQIATLALVK